MSKGEIWKFIILNNVISLFALYLVATIIAVYMLDLRNNYGAWHYGKFGVWIGVLYILILMLIAWRWIKGVIFAVRLNRVNKAMKISSLIYLTALPVVLVDITPNLIEEIGLLFHK